MFVQQERRPSSPVTADVDVPDLIGPGQQLVDTAEFVVEANWKVLLEGFLEGYHQGDHRNTFLRSATTT